MKISTRRILMAVLAGAGLFAVALAYRSGPESNNVSVNFVMPSGSDSASIQPFQQADVPVTRATTEQASDEIPESMSAKLELPDFGSDVEFIDTAMEDRETEVQPSSAELSIETTRESKPGLPRDSKGWQSNPFLHSKRRASTAELVSAELELEAQSSQLDLPEDSVTSLYTDMESAPVDVETGPAVATSQTETIAPNPLSETAIHKAVYHIEYGKSLARRNASEAASQEFLTALRVLAQSIDSATGTNEHTMSLRNGMMAIKEAQDFKIVDPQRQIVVDVADILESHETKVIDRVQAESMTSTDAIHHYLIYAGQELSTCGGQNVVAAEALYCLGKLKSIAAKNKSDPASLDLTEAIVYHHASLTADPANFRSANELGVLLAHNGQLAEAESYLKSSLRIRPMPQSWANLAKVHQRKGTPEDMQLANLAINEFHVALNAETSAPVTGAIQWVTPQQFEARSSIAYPEAATQQQQTSQAVMPASNETGTQNRSFVERIGEIIPKGFLR